MVREWGVCGVVEVVCGVLREWGVCSVLRVGSVWCVGRVGVVRECCDVNVGGLWCVERIQCVEW